jgi:uncharacterized protein
MGCLDRSAAAGRCNVSTAGLSCGCTPPASRYGCGVKSAILFRTALLLICSNMFMTFAWYAHLRNWNDKKWYIAALLSWGIALFEYLFLVPANRLGYTTLSLAQLKVLQEIITLSVFAPFAVLYMHQPIKLDYLWSGLCLAGAAYFMFRS